MNTNKKNVMFSSIFSRRLKIACANNVLFDILNSTKQNIARQQYFFLKLTLI
jgi:hypothetical protein